FNVTDELAAATFPVVIPKLAFVASLKRSIDELEKLELRLNVRLNDQTLMDAGFPVDFQGKLKTRCIGFMQGLVLTAAGDLQFRLTNDGIEIANWHIDIVPMAPRIDLINEPAGPVPPVLDTST